MFRLFKKRPSGPTVLTVTLDGAEVCRIAQDAVSARHKQSIALQSEQPQLHFTDSAGQTYIHDLTAFRAQGLRWLHLDVRVSDRFAAEADGLLSASGSAKVAEAEFAAHGPAIRFQPIYLPECAADPTTLVGKGLFYRGLQFQGTISPSNIALGCICDACRRSFVLSCFHAGFSDLVYFFCDGGPHTLVASSYIEDAPQLLTDAEPADVASFEARLPACVHCGGHFAYLNPLLCPHCHAPYIDFRRFPQLRAVEYYGCTLYGDNSQQWEG